MSESKAVRARKGTPLPSQDAAVTAARAASDKKAFDVRVLEVADLIVIIDYFVICSGTTQRQVRAIVEAVEKALAALGLRAVRREGERGARWVLLDFGDVVVHVFVAEEREYYELERLWKDAPDIAWSDEATGEAATERSMSAGASAGSSDTTRRRARS